MLIWLFLGSLLAIGLADRAGRRLLLIISGLGMGLSNLGLVLNQEQLLNHVLMDNMLPVSALCSFYVFFTLGFGSLPFVILGEIFPAQSKVGNIRTGCPITNCTLCALQKCQFVVFLLCFLLGHGSLSECLMHLVPEFFLCQSLFLGLVFNSLPRPLSDECILLLGGRNVRLSLFARN